MRVNHTVHASSGTVRSGRFSAKYRVCRRLRMLFAALVLTVLFLSAGLCGHMKSMANETGVPCRKYYTSIRIAEGDTLWSIAREYNTRSGLSERDYIDELCRINRLAGQEIHAGHYLTVAYYLQEE